MRATFRQLRGTDPDDQFEEVRLAFERLGADVLNTLIPQVAIGTTSTKLAHGLGSVPSGWQVYSQEGDARIWQAAPADSQFLYLIASAAVITGIRVF